jgi:uncharacterized membrane protein
MTYSIIVDLSHNEQFQDFPEFSLGEDDYEVDYLEKKDGPIEFELLEDYDIFFIGNIKHTKNGKDDKFKPRELQAIKKFVGEGGGLLLTSGDGGDRDITIKQGSIRVLYKVTGVRRYWNGVILESHSNFLVNKSNLRLTELYAHPITEGISEIVFPNCTFFSVAEEDVEDLIVTGEKAEFQYYIDDDVDQIGQVPICVATEFYTGRCITIGSSDFMLEDHDFGLDAGENLKFLENIIHWLTGEI